MPADRDWTICAPPKISATPTTIEKHQDHGMREVNAMKPAATTAIVAAVVANVPVMNERTDENAVFSGWNVAVCAKADSAPIIAIVAPKMSTGAYRSTFPRTLTFPETMVHFSCST
jgi:hypothetical protein